MNLDEFRELLKRYRSGRRWSQEHTAAECDMDHSLVSRIEGGQRNPTRDAIGKFSTGLGLSEAQRDELLMLAGYAPDSAASILRDDPELQLLYRTLHDPETPPLMAQQIRGMLALINGLTRERAPLRLVS